MRGRIWAVLLVVASLAACSPRESEPVATPMPTQVPLVPIGDQMVAPTLQQVLYYPSREGTQLTPQLSTITIMPEETPVEALMTQLLEPPTDGLSEPVFPAGANARLLSVEQSEDVVTVDLSGYFSMEASRLFSARAAIVNTLTELSDVRFVNVLFNGVSEPLVELFPDNDLLSVDIPVGAMARVSDDIGAAFAEIESERRRLEQSRSAEPMEAGEIERQVVLYFASPDGTMLLPEVRAITFSGDDLVTPIIRELARGPADTDRMRRALPAGDVAIAGADGMNREGSLLEVNLSSWRISEFIPTEEEFQPGVDVRPELTWASILRSVVGFIPNVEEVRFWGNNRNFERADLRRYNDVVRVSDLPVEVGRNVQLFFPTADGRLRREVRPFSQYDAASPRAWLREIFAGAQGDAQDGIENLRFPDAWREDAVLGIAIVGDEMQINITRAAAESFSGIDPLRERAYLFSLINTLCGMPGVRRVSILIEGAPVASLGGAIRLEEPLMPNPGIVLR